MRGIVRVDRNVRTVSSFLEWTELSVARGSGLSGEGWDGVVDSVAGQLLQVCEYPTGTHRCFCGFAEISELPFRQSTLGVASIIHDSSTVTSFSKGDAAQQCVVQQKKGWSQRKAGTWQALLRRRHCNPGVSWEVRTRSEHLQVAWSCGSRFQNLSVFQNQRQWAVHEWWPGRGGCVSSGRWGAC